MNNLRRSRSRAEGRSEPPLVQLGVRLGRGDALVPQGHLDEPDITGLVVQPCAKCVSQGMGRDGLGDACFEASSGDDPLHLSAGQSVADSSSKKWLCQLCVTGHGTQLVQDDTCHWHGFGFTALGVLEDNATAFEVDVVGVQGHGLCKSASRVEHEHDDRAIALGPPACERERGKRFDLILSQHLGRE